jgi:Dolichyl-phosphate-mannose-protein mannosyltransferase
LWGRLQPLRDRAAEAWALWSILAAQATLTLPWMWRTVAYSDEASYLMISHDGWGHLMSYGKSLPGVPVLYLPIVSVFDSAGGLIAARLLSLIFMLGTTSLVYLMGDRLFGRTSGVLAALLFAVCGIIVHLGAAATFDPMALFLLVLALYSAVRMRDSGARWLIICPLALVAANAAKYATAAWDPLVVGAILLYGLSRGKTQAIVLALSVALTTAVMDLSILLLGGSDMASGILVNTLYGSPEVSHPESSGAVLKHAMLMTGLITLIAIAGIWVSVVQRMPGSATAFLCLLVLAALIAPLDQAGVGQLTSLDENMGFGLPFAALAAGYALGAWPQWLGSQRHWGKIVATTAAVITVITMLIVGRVERVQFRGAGAANASAVLAAIGQHYIRSTSVLDDAPLTIARYYLQGIPADKWVPSPAISNGFQMLQLQNQICSRQYSVVVLGAQTGHFNVLIRELIKHSHLYKLAVTTGAGVHTTRVWYLPRQGKKSRRLTTVSHSSQPGESCTG